MSLPRLSAGLGGHTDVWIKREDLLPIGLGGNKLRNLEYLVGEALESGADTLVTSGRRWSNHCRLTAAAGAVAGLEVHLVLSGPTPDEPGPNQRLDELLGATVHVASSGDRSDREALVADVAARLRDKGRRPAVIDVGGSGVTGAIGQVAAGLELAEQASAIGIAPAAFVLPTATGGTQAGLELAVSLAGLETEVVGVAVAHPSGELLPAVGRMLDGLTDLLGPDARRSDRQIGIDDRWLGDGYGHRSADAEAATSLLARTEGILVDPIYTAKALAGLIAEVEAGRWQGRSVVFWHAGGTPGLFEPLDD
jgi:1-aminocyclopropane-1-carboxylate deaminase/D-cysteine desulfhydrase-like pyridoxal-dependent ACC family enzyme